VETVGLLSLTIARRAKKTTGLVLRPTLIPPLEAAGI
jgi:hypothetical protein